MIDVFFCTNRVNHTVAWHGVMQDPARARATTTVLLHEPWRYVPPSRPGVRAWPINVWTMRWLRAMVTLRRVRTLFVPHESLNRRANWCIARAPEVAYLDDGLDTHREAPLHFDLRRARPRRRFHTFVEFDRLPPWLDAFDVTRRASLADLAAASALPSARLDGVEHVIVESKRLDVPALADALALPPSRVLLVRHPVPAKRGAMPEACRVVDGADVNLERSLLESQGRTFYMGETHALIFAAATSAHVRNDIVVPDLRASLPSLRLRPTATPGWFKLAGLERDPSCA